MERFGSNKRKIERYVWQDEEDFPKCRLIRKIVASMVIGKNMTSKVKDSHQNRQTISKGDGVSVRFLEWCYKPYFVVTGQGAKVNAKSY